MTSGLFKAMYMGEPGLYKHQEYIINIGTIENRVVIVRKCGAGKVWYNSIIEFLSNWDNIRKV